MGVIGLCPAAGAPGVGAGILRAGIEQHVVDILLSSRGLGNPVLGLAAVVFVGVTGGGAVGIQDADGAAEVVEGVGFLRGHAVADVGEGSGVVGTVSNGHGVALGAVSRIFRDRFHPRFKDIIGPRLIRILDVGAVFVGDSGGKNVGGTVH